MTKDSCVNRVTNNPMNNEEENDETHSLSSVSSSIMIKSVTSGMWCELQNEK